MSPVAHYWISLLLFYSFHPHSPLLCPSVISLKVSSLTSLDDLDVENINDFDDNLNNIQMPQDLQHRYSPILEVHLLGYHEKH